MCKSRKSSYPACLVGTGPCPGMYICITYRRRDVHLYHRTDFWCVSAVHRCIHYHQSQPSDTTHSPGCWTCTASPTTHTALPSRLPQGACTYLNQHHQNGHLVSQRPQKVSPPERSLGPCSRNNVICAKFECSGTCILTPISVLPCAPLGAGPLRCDAWHLATTCFPHTQAPQRPGFCSIPAVVYLNTSCRLHGAHSLHSFTVCTRHIPQRCCPGGCGVTQRGHSITRTPQLRSTHPCVQRSHADCFLLDGLPWTFYGRARLCETCLEARRQ